MNFHDDLLNNIETNSVRDPIRHQSISTCPKFNIIYESSPIFRQFFRLIQGPLYSLDLKMKRGLGWIWFFLSPGYVQPLI